MRPSKLTSLLGDSNTRGWAQSGPMFGGLWVSGRPERTAISRPICCSFPNVCFFSGAGDNDSDTNTRHNREGDGGGDDNNGRSSSRDNVPDNISNSSGNKGNCDNRASDSMNCDMGNGENGNNDDNNGCYHTNNCTAGPGIASPRYAKAACSSARVNMPNQLYAPVTTTQTATHSNKKRKEYHGEKTIAKQTAQGARGANNNSNNM